MAKIKTKNVIKKTIKTLDKAAIASARMKSAYVKKRTDVEEQVFTNIKDKKQTPELKLIQNERQLKIINAIENLKPKYKEVIMLYEIEGVPYEQIAKKLNCPLGTVKSRLYNAKKELYEVLQDLI